MLQTSQLKGSFVYLVWLTRCFYRLYQILKINLGKSSVMIIFVLLLSGAPFSGPNFVIMKNWLKSKNQITMQR